MMGLQRIDHWPKVSSDGQSGEWVAVESCDGDFYRVADVDALLTRIRAAVDAERDARDEAAQWRSPVVWDRRDAAIAALDALLSQGVADG